MPTGRLKKWRNRRAAERKRFPVRWMTFKQRVQDDVERAYKAEGGKDFFNETFVAKLAEAARSLEGWEIKLFVSQLTISIFMVLGLITTDASISLLGLSLKNTPGLAEVLLALSATLAVALQGVAQAKYLRLNMIEKIRELSTDAKFVVFGKVADAAAFNMQFYAARGYEKYVFPTWRAQLISALLYLAFTLLCLSFFALSVLLWLFWNAQILRELSLGIWSRVALCYVWLAYGTAVLWLIKANLPLPYRDQSALQELAELEKSDPAAYLRRLAELYPEIE